MNPLLDVRVVDDSHIVGVWGRTLIPIWRGPATGEASAEVNRIGRELVASSTVPATLLFIVERSSPPPGDETRKNFAALSRDIVSKMPVGVVVAEGGGFRAAIVRAVGVTLTTLVPHAGNFKFVNDLNQGIQLLGPYLPPGSGGTDGLARVVEELRGSIGRKR